MSPRLALTTILAVALACGAAVAAPKRPAHAVTAGEAPAYATNAITVTANGRQGTPASATCVVWANAEGLGVGPDQLNGFHGLSMNINPKPLPGETDAKPSTTADGLKALKAQSPTAPAWLLAAIEKNAARIDAACSEEHVEPLTIVKLTARDKAA